MRSAGTTRRDFGFTLIELMVVVALIGILATLAIASFSRMQARTKQTEAKANLKAIFTSKRAWYAEYATHVCGRCGWAPESGYVYNYYVAAGSHVTDGTGGCDESMLNGSGEDVEEFTAGASADIDSDGVCDGWNINHDNDLSNTSPDV